MTEDLSGPYPGYGLGAIDAYDGYISYRLLDAHALAPEIAEMRALMDRDWRTLEIDQDIGLGMMLWLAHFFPEDWAHEQLKPAAKTSFCPSSRRSSRSRPSRSIRPSTSPSPRRGLPRHRW